MYKHKILVAEAEPFVNKSLQDLISSEMDASVVGVLTCQEAIEYCKMVHTALLGIRFPDGWGVDVIHYLRREGLSVRTIVFTEFRDETFILRLLRLGVDGMVFRNSATNTEICEAVKLVTEGKAYFQDEVRAIISARPERIRDAKDLKFSPREIEIVKLLSHGYSSKEIADTMCLSSYTVDGYRKEMLKKTEARNTTELIALTFRVGILN